MIHRRFHVLLLVVSIASATPPARAQQSADGSSITYAGQIEQLLKSRDLSAWRAPTGAWLMTGDVALDPANDRKLSWKDGAANLVNGPDGRTSNLLTREEFSDIQAHVEFMISRKSNSGVYFMGRYELQIYDSFGVAKDEYPGIECGGIYPRRIDNHTIEGHSPSINASLPPGQWQAFDVTFRAPRFDAAGHKIADAVFVKVVHNGKVIHENVEVKGATRSALADNEVASGPLMLQGDHGPVAFRNIQVTLLSPPTTAPAASPVNSPQVSVEQIEYNDWPQAWRLRNQICELIVVPAVSRVMRFSLVGGKNLLWENPELAGKTFPTDDGTWHNIGGEKLWPTQQKDLFKKYTGHDGWPPPWPWDAGPSAAEPIPNGVRLTLPLDKRFGAHAVREFTLDARQPLVHVRQWIEKTEGEPAQITVWTVCQVNDPFLSLLPSADGKYSDFGYPNNQMTAKAGYATLGRGEKEGLKIGVLALGNNGWVASIFPAQPQPLMLVLSHKLEASAHYPDDGLQAEIYTAPKSIALYTEMELLSPLIPLKVGERLEDDAVWQIIPVNGTDYARIAAAAHDQALGVLKG